MVGLASVFPLAVAAQTGTLADSVWQRIGESWVVAGVLGVLVAMSLACWFIIVYKWLNLRELERQSARFRDAFWKAPRLDALGAVADDLRLAPTARLFKAGLAELDRMRGADGEARADGDDVLAAVERGLRRASLSETAALERGVSFLGTTGSTAPFIGLFGTVWGIMQAFAHISPGSNLLVAVAPHIAEALVATAIGLLAAIPAVIAYNYFVRRIRLVLVEMDNFTAEFLNVVQRHLL